MLGRLFVPDDGKPGHNDVQVLGYNFWQKSFHGDRGIIDYQVTIDGDPYAVIGVLPPNMDVPGNVGEAIYSPLVTDDKNIQDRDNAGFMPFGLLLPGVPVAQGTGRPERHSQATAARLPQRGRQRSDPREELNLEAVIETNCD